VNPTWQSEVLTIEQEKPYFKKLLEFIRTERAKHEVYPPPGKVFTAFNATPLHKVRVMILGQDPYHDRGQAHGLSFSVPPGVAVPPSLQNIYKELHSDLGTIIPAHGHLLPWAQSGVFLLNATLTVRAHEPASHQGQGWEIFTDSVIRLLAERDQHMVFILWGRYARAKAALIDRTKHTIIEAAHPSPMSASNGFFGSKPFSKTNQALADHKQAPIDWRL
jgi:uracil-DNA glycosylase